MWFFNFCIFSFFPKFPKFWCFPKISKKLIFSKKFKFEGLKHFLLLFHHKRLRKQQDWCYLFIVKYCQKTTYDYDFSNCSIIHLELPWLSLENGYALQAGTEHSFSVNVRVNNTTPISWESAEVTNDGVSFLDLFSRVTSIDIIVT